MSKYLTHFVIDEHFESDSLDKIFKIRDLNTTHPYSKSTVVLTPVKGFLLESEIDRSEPFSPFVFFEHIYLYYLIGFVHHVFLCYIKVTHLQFLV